MRAPRPLLAVLAAAPIALGVAPATGVSPASVPPAVVAEPGAGGLPATPPPPAPTLRLRSGGRTTTMALESFIRPRTEGPGYDGAALAPPPGRRLPRLRAPVGRAVAVDARRDARSVRVELLTRSSGRTRRLRSRRLDGRRWQFVMPCPRGRVLRVRVAYADGASTSALAALGASRPTTRR